MDSTPPSLLQQLGGADRGPAWGRFVRLYTPLMLAWAGKIGVPPADRADLVQDVFVTLLKTLPAFRYDPARSFRGFLRTLLANRWTDARRKRAPAAVGSDLDGEAAPDPVPELDEAEYRAAVVGRAAQLVKADFSEATWRVFWETTALGRPAAEVAAEHGLTPNAVYLARARVLHRLRAELDGLLD